MISFTIMGQPQGKARHRTRVVKTRGGKAFAQEYPATKTVLAEQSFLAQSLPFKPDTPLAGPLAITLQFHFLIPQSWSKRKKIEAQAGMIRPTGKPDIDNAIKLLDALNGVFWRDDAQIVDIHAAKHYSHDPRTVVEIAEVFGPLTF